VFGGELGEKLTDGGASQDFEVFLAETDDISH
jgi:hypothetical protein